MNLENEKKNVRMAIKVAKESKKNGDLPMAILFYVHADNSCLPQK